MAGKQVDDGTRPRILGREVEIPTGPEQRTQRLLKSETGVAAAHQRRDACGRPGGPLQALRDRRLQRAMRGDFQKDVGPADPAGGFDSRGEQHGPADIGPPVGAVQPLRGLAGHRRDEGRTGVEGAIVKEGESRQRVVPDGVHYGGMEGDIARQKHMLQPAPVQFRGNRIEDVLLAADHGVGRCVDAGDLDPAGALAAGGAGIGGQGNAQFLEQFLDARTVEADRQHSTGAGRALLQRGAPKDEAGGFLQRQGPAGVSGGDLARAVADHAIRIDAPGLEQFDQRTLDHEDGGLRQPHFVELALRGGEAGVSQRGIRVLAPMLLDGVDDAAEDRVGVVQLAAAARPLRTLAREDHDQPLRAVIHRRDRRGVGGERIERVGQLAPVPRRKRGARGEMGTAAAQIAGQRIEVEVLLVERFPESLRAPGQRAGGAGGKRNHEACGRGGRHGPGLRSRRAVFSNHAVAVGPAEAERVDSDDDGALGKGLAGRLHLHRAGVEVDLRVRRQEIPGSGSERAMPQHQDDFEQGAMERRCFHVAHVALDAGQA